MEIWVGHHLDTVRRMFIIGETEIQSDVVILIIDLIEADLVLIL